MIITISGKPGSGKSTIAKLLAKKLGYKHYSIGDMQRELAQERGLTIREIGDYEARDPSFDKALDNKQKELGEKQDNFVIDAWLSAHFIPKAIKIFLDVDFDTGVKRIFKAKGRLAKRKYKTIEEAKQDVKKRDEVNKERWFRYYHFNYYDKSHYDLVIDTTHITPDQVIDKIMSFVKKKK